jgi:hypothetical protein
MRTLVTHVNVSDPCELRSPRSVAPAVVSYSYQLAALGRPGSLAK